MFRPELVKNRLVRPNFPPQQIPQGIQAEAMGFWWPMLPDGAEGFGLYAYPPGYHRRAGGQFVGSWNASTHWVYDLEIGWYLNFDTDRYIFRSNQDIWKYDTGDIITISAWVNPNGGGNNEQTIISSGGYNVARNWCLLYYNDSHFETVDDNRLSFMWSNSSSTSVQEYISPTGTLLPNVWTHICVKHHYGDGSDSKIWINGEVVMSGGASNAAPYTGYQDLYFGKNADDAADPQRFAGGITDVRIYRDHPDSDQLVYEMYNPASRWDLYYPQQRTNKTFFVQYIDTNALIPKNIINTPQVGTPAIDTTAQHRYSTVVVQIIGTAVGQPKVTSIGVEILGEMLTISGGSVAGGEADEYLFDDIEGIGGAVAGGQVSIYNHQYIENASGGVEGGGAAVIKFFEIGSGGAVAGGTGLIFEGTFGGGEAEVNVIYTLEGSSAGVESAGDVLAGFEFEDFGNAGSELGGESVDFVVILVGETGIVASGSADEYFFDHIDATGGAVVNGVAIKVEYWQQQGSGGAELSGAALNSIGRVFSIMADGGLIYGGTHDFWHTLTQRPEGGVVVNNGIDPPFLFNWSYIYKMSGRVVLDGQIIVKPNTFVFVSDGDGNMRVGGNADFTIIYNDRNCTTFRCNVNYPNRYIECFSPALFDPRQGKGQLHWEGGPALLAAITACRQYLYLPPADDEDGL